jgi:hypothetical protein
MYKVYVFLPSQAWLRLSVLLKKMKPNDYTLINLSGWGYATMLRRGCYLRFNHSMVFGIDLKLKVRIDPKSCSMGYLVF